MILILIKINYMQNPPNDGALQLVGNLGVNFEGVGDMDIMPDNTTALAVTNSNSISSLFTIDLMTGKAVNVGKFTASVISIAFKTNPLLMLQLQQICWCVLTNQWNE
jgi:hypothetical protein